MGVADHAWDAGMVEAALFRSGGVKQASYRYGPATNPDPAAGFRHYKPKGVGHAFVHVAGAGSDLVGHGAGLAKKSRYADEPTAIAVIVEILNTAQGLAALRRLDANPGSTEWLHGATAVPITGAWYGYAPNETGRRKILTASINLNSHGEALFIHSSYPEGLQAATPPAAPAGPAP
ncbi:hypothetical protein OPKNFCMD_6128 [Methylobacterium crusticola]|uniref:Bacterial CdiA-CT RNAse A domain-containing protein n=1 Tax=Methylobacterium crusticola TaxID=1697972 RepID=A0ABQ4R6Q9_9HYPH|nr:hypothetical protein [Methylobacterium crusticola]GJD53353.1 hypothetical protein OPKNFCMD_6128 [Methylobacterium crusticola]